MERLIFFIVGFAIGFYIRFKHNRYIVRKEKHIKEIIENFNKQHPPKYMYLDSQGNEISEQEFYTQFKHT